MLCDTGGAKDIWGRGQIHMVWNNLIGTKDTWGMAKDRQVGGQGHTDSSQGYV